MSLKTIVKVSHISNLSDARYCAGMGVAMLGVSVVPSAKNYMTPQAFQDIRGWIAGPKIIAELYGLSMPADIEKVMDAYSPDYFELAFGEYQTFGHQLSVPCIIYLPKGEFKNAVARADKKIAFYIVDEPTECGEFPGEVPVLVRVSSPNILEKKLAAGCFSGIVLEGPERSRPGVTNYEALGDLLEALEERED
ncbi:MAG TPA: hypothetical protein VF490_01985 [Chryseosolibacter sp.]